MKKPLFLLFIFPLLVACSNNNDDNDDNDDNIKYDETKGYLTNIVSVKYGIQDGVWLSTSSGYHNKYEVDNIRYSGASANELNEKAKYELIKNGDNYVLRLYAIGDLEGVGSYVDAIITKLDKNNLYYSVNGQEPKYRKVTK